MQIVNIAAYRFITLSNLPELKQTLLSLCRSLDLKGTVLLAEEGINLFLAGSRQHIDAFVDGLRHGPVFEGRLADLEVKESFSSTVPFRKMLVKIKREIIRMNHPAIRPEAGRAPAVDSQTALRWITQGKDDLGRPVVLLDTRNDFEVDEGTFEGAIDWRLRKFTEFPEQVQAHGQELESKTVISFCTGGIRCEKAAIYMQGIGLEHVYQLEGGILKYFEETGGQAYHGRCFVFDEREALDPGLRPKR